MTIFLMLDKLVCSKKITYISCCLQTSKVQVSAEPEVYCSKSTSASSYERGAGWEEFAWAISSRNYFLTRQDYWINKHYNEFPCILFLNRKMKYHRFRHLSYLK